MVKGLHIELTNKCTLKCPRCARTTFIDTFGNKKWRNVDIDRHALLRFLDIDLTGIPIVLCGNYGDPIYHPNLIDIVHDLKQLKARVIITTNGSYRDVHWWQNLTTALDQNDEIIFSIDGLPGNFTKYRINADWPSIELAIKTVAATNIQLTWKFIPFSFNENNIQEAKQLAEQLGFTNFQIDPSDRWIENDWLKPSSYQGQRELPISNWMQGERTIEIEPKCHNDTTHYISADGYYMPCCWVSHYSFYYKSEFYKNRSQYDIKTTTLSSLLKLESLTKFYNDININKLDYCTFNCPKTKGE